MELVFVGVLATMGFASWALWRRAARPPQLPSGERTLGTLQVGDVVQHLGHDYVVDGALSLRGAGSDESAYLYKLGAEQPTYLWFSGEGDPGLLQPRPEKFDPPSDTLELDGTLYYRRTVRELTAMRSGDVGLRRVGGPVTVRLYGSGDGRLLLLLLWSDGANAFAGTRVAAHLVDLLPGR